MGIRSFGNRAPKRFARGDQRRLPPKHAPKIARLLKLLDNGSSPESLRAAGCRVHRLTGDRRGFSAIEGSGGWCIVFRFEDGNAHDVEGGSYHWS